MLFSASTSLIATPAASQPGLPVFPPNAWNPEHRVPGEPRIRSPFRRR